MYSAKFLPKGLGWIPDLPDPRDYACHQQLILLGKSNPGLLAELTTRKLSLASRDDSSVVADAFDLRNGDEGEVFISPAEDQGSLQSSTSFAVLSMIEYFERRRGYTFNGSKLFLYKVARNLRARMLEERSDAGADLRTTFKALRQLACQTKKSGPTTHHLSTKSPQRSSTMRRNP